MSLSNKLRTLIRDVPDFPKKGIIFKDITPLLKDAEALKAVADVIANRFSQDKIDVVAGIESRGFIIGAPVAIKLGVGFVPIRKKGKLPYKKIGQEYLLEYGTDSIEIHEDAIAKGERVLVVDDLLATGGTALATAKLVEKLGGVVVSFAVIVELGFLNGAEKIVPHNVFSLINYSEP
ncbi:MAG: adenine phosphoribosyltransferase [Candidatus Schekmanbacteria bacterium RBG_16_38_10]|uniref:Adenine phosphoribosyltransferase n=1 Tax=Candidatus Schekmanbacteria bacterium RBG_16_38_10 TaxID=1817879 RepID=A0A1F7RXU0_9BACT|nr:MAG: adenine phosphoribosyltransferase [Candidatus Schekmanbacteria bacterium RBG_16_38_10]